MADGPALGPGRPPHRARRCGPRDCGGVLRRLAHCRGGGRHLRGPDRAGPSRTAVCRPPVYSMCTAHANDFAPSDTLAQTAGGLLIAYGLGASAGPVLTSNLMEMFGPSTLFMVNTWVHGSPRGVRPVPHVAPRAEAEGPSNAPSSRRRAVSSRPAQLYTSMRDHADRDLARMTGAKRRGEPHRRRGGSRRRVPAETRQGEVAAFSRRRRDSPASGVPSR